MALAFNPQTGRFEDDNKKKRELMAIQERAQQAQGNKKSFWTDQISTVLGTLGAIGGTMVAPVIGTAAGGAGGAALGELIENKLTGEDWKKNLIKEAALGGVFSAGPLRLAKYAKGANVALRAGAPGATAMSAGKSAAATPFMQVFKKGFTPTLETGRKAATTPAAAALTGNIDEATAVAPKVIAATGKPSVAARTYSKAFTIPAKLSGRLDPLKTSQELLDYGITGNIDDIAARSGAVLNKLGGITDKSVAKVNGFIKTGDVETVALNAVDGIPVQDRFKKALMDSVTGASKNAPMPGYIHPTDALELTRKLEKQGYGYIQAGTNFMNPRPEMSDLGHAYLLASDEIKDKLYGAVAKKATLKEFQNPATIKELNTLAKGLGDRFAQTKGLDEVRSLMAPFVRANKLVEITQANANTPFTQLGRAITGGGPISQITQRITSPITEHFSEAHRGLLATKSAAAMQRGGAAGTGGSRFNPFAAFNKGRAEAVPGKVSLAIRNYMANAAAQGTPAMGTTLAMGDGLSEEEKAALASGAISPEEFFDANSPVGGAAGALDSTTGQAPPFDPFGQFAGAGGPTGVFSDESIQQMLEADIKTTGGKNIGEISKIVAIRDALYPAPEPGAKQNATQQKTAMAIDNANHIVDEMEQGYSQVKKGRVGGRLQSVPAALGFAPEASTYDQSRGMYVTALARTLSGEVGTMTDRDIARAEGLVPKRTDTPAEAAIKVRNARSAISAKKQSLASLGGGFDPFEAMQMAAAGGGGGGGFDPFAYGF